MTTRLVSRVACQVFGRAVVLACVAGAIARSALLAQATQPPVEVVIEGTITERDRLAWIERSFEVPAATARIDVEATYTDRDRGTAIEFGLSDPERPRGASRTSKSRFFVARDAATPSYLPGTIQPGPWRLVLGVASIRPGVRSSYRVTVRFTPADATQPTPLEVSGPAADAGPRWYRGDLHAHTMHSDGFGCLDIRAEPGPCTAHVVADAAERRGLDFVAVTDHNTTSHHQGMVEVQARHERLLLLRGQEVTTFYGHANAYGTSEILDHRIGSAGVTARDVFARARHLGALVSINHPARETGERCTGCGWTAPDTDYGLVDAIEVVNGRTVSGQTAGEPFWHARLNEGFRITGIGGSDDHGASTRAGSAIGTPTTMVFADALTEQALLAGIRAGHVYIKTRGPDGPDVRLTVPATGAMMGDAVSLDGGSAVVRLHLDVTGGRGQRLDVIRNGAVVGGVAAVDAHTAVLDIPVTVTPGDWVRVNLGDAAGPTVITNPIYVRRRTP